ncbi:hypothetical protein V1511DRAFT_491039 [Dipodascopsis uninucleata]
MRFSILLILIVGCISAIFSASSVGAASAAPVSKYLLARAEKKFTSVEVPKVDSSEGSPLARTEHLKESIADKDLNDIATARKTSKQSSTEVEETSSAAKMSSTTISYIDEGENTDFFKSFSMSFMMIIFSEIGDKTFLIAAIMAMKHSRTTVFSGAFASLVIMTVLSALLGHAVPQLIPKKYTSFLASVLFIVFGVKLIMEGISMSSDAGVEEEMHEVENELDAKEFTSQNDSLESGGRARVEPLLKQYLGGFLNLCALVFSPVWIQTFVMTFLGEWGDRSQIATIAMAAGTDYWFVILGAIVGHGLCTLSAVIGGKLLASKISLRTITLVGGAAFFVFAIIYFYEFLNL